MRLRRSCRALKKFIEKTEQHFLNWLSNKSLHFKKRICSFKTRSLKSLKRLQHGKKQNKETSLGRQDVAVIKKTFNSYSSRTTYNCLMVGNGVNSFLKFFFYYKGLTKYFFDFFTFTRSNKQFRNYEFEFLECFD